MSNPLIAAPEKSSKDWTGAGIADTAEDLYRDIALPFREGKEIDPVALGIDATAMAFDIAGAVADPLGTLASSIVGWIIENVDFVRRRGQDALDNVTRRADDWASNTNQRVGDWADRVKQGADARAQKVRDVYEKFGQPPLTTRSADMPDPSNGVQRAGDSVDSRTGGGILDGQNWVRAVAGRDIGHLMPTPGDLVAPVKEGLKEFNNQFMADKNQKWD